MQAIASQLKATFCRSGEYVGRYGGEEFVVLLSTTDGQMAEREAERIQEVIAFLDYPHQYSSIASRVTVSQGVFSFQATGKEKKQICMKSSIEHSTHQNLEVAIHIL